MTPSRKSTSHPDLLARARGVFDVPHKRVRRADQSLVRLTHGRHCPCSACERQDWTDPRLAPCGMHGPSCPPVYAPSESPLGTYVDRKTGLRRLESDRIAELEAQVAHLRREIHYLVTGGES